jgi:hypothetical protein
MNISTQSLLTLNKLRPPFARSASILFQFTGEGRVNAGITVEMAVGEPAVAAGSGTVEKIYTQIPQFQTTDTVLKTTAVKHVLIDHGNGVKTLVGGLHTVAVKQGQTVYRGDILGSLLAAQLFFSVTLANKMMNPLALNSHWITQNSNVVPGQGGKIRFAPDRVVRDLSHGVAVIWNSGVNYFKQLLGPAPLLINIDFNGDGTKTGLAAAGLSATDYWNVYTPTNFLASVAYACYAYYPYGFYTFNEAPVVCLQDYANERSSVFLQRVAPLDATAGVATNIDRMLDTWIGGYLGLIPYENTFRIRNLPAGNYDLFLYANQGVYPSASTFYVSVNTGLPTSKFNSPIVTPVFAENSNYVKFQLAVPASGYITFKTVGYLSGLQLQRT